MKPRIIIYVSGGIVQEVRADTDELDIEVYDLDNADAEEREEEREYFEQLWQEFDGLPYVVF